MGLVDKNEFLMKFRHESRFAILRTPNGNKLAMILTK